MCCISMIGFAELASSSTGAALLERPPSHQVFQSCSQRSRLAEPDVAEDREDQDEADEDVHPVLRQHEGRAVGANDLKRKERAQQRYHGSAGQGADDRAEAAKDGSAADDDGRNGVEFAKLAGCRDEAAIKSNVNDSGK